MNHLPPTLDARGLAILLAPILHKKTSTLLRDISRRPATLPPSEIRGGKKIWFVQVVQEWLAGGEHKQIVIVLDIKSSSASSVNLPPAIQSTAEMLMAIPKPAKNGKKNG